MLHLASTLLAIASVAAAQMLVTRQVSDTPQLHTAMDDLTVNMIEMAAGVYRLADEPGLGCSAPDPPFSGVSTPYFLCIQRNLTIRAAAGASVVLSGGKKKGVVYVLRGITASLQGLEITNGSSAGPSGGGVGPPSGGVGGAGIRIEVGGVLTLVSCEVHHHNATPVRFIARSQEPLRPALLRAPTAGRIARPRRRGPMAARSRITAPSPSSTARSTTTQLGCSSQRRTAPRPPPPTGRVTRPAGRRWPLQFWRHRRHRQQRIPPQRGPGLWRRPRQLCRLHDDCQQFDPRQRCRGGRRYPQ